MSKTFPIDELKELVKPEDLIDVLDSLFDNGLISGYYYNYECGEVEIDIPKNVEIAEIVAGFKELSGNGKRMH